MSSPLLLIIEDDETISLSLPDTGLPVPGSC